MTIPNTITIYVKTNIMGNSFFKLKPSMIVPNNTSENILFDPLVKLSQSVVDKQTGENRKLQFLDKSLFKSLIVQSETFQSYRTLQQATKEGIVDNNIKILLNTLLNDGSVIYLKNNPYTSIQYTWKTGNWKIDTKLPSTSSRAVSQYPVQSIYYQHSMNTSYMNAVKEIQELPQDVKEGANFKPEEYEIPKVTATPQETKPISTSVVPPITPVVTPPVAKPPITEESIIAQINKEETKSLNQNIKYDVNHTINTPIMKINTRKTRKVGTTSSVPGKQNATYLLTTYFKRKKYYLILKNIFSYLQPSEKEFIITTSKPYFPLSSKPTNLYSENMNNKLANSIHIYQQYKLEPQQNNFYNSIAHCMNDYKQKHHQSFELHSWSSNTTHPETITPEYIQEECITLILNNESTYTIFIENAKKQATKMNAIFAENISKIGTGTTITEERYITEVNNIFFTNNHYLVNKVSKMPNNTDESFNTPFSSPQTKDELKAYLLSNPQFDDKMIDVIKQIFNVQVLIIQQVENKYYNFPIQQLVKYFNTNNKYLFLYLEGEQYFPIYFQSYKQNVESRDYMFNENDKDVVPPFCLLVFIYGKLGFFNWDDEHKNANILFKNMLNSIDKSFDSIIQRQFSSPNPNDELFLQSFSSEFPSHYFNNIGTHVGTSTTKATETGTGSAAELGAGVQAGGQVTPIRNESIGKPSNIGYYITINMYLYPGKDIPPNKLKDIECQMKKDNVYKSWAELRNLRYSPQPVTSSL